MVVRSEPGKSKGKVLVTFEGGLYDVGAFLADHPGGEDVIRQWAGQDITAVFGDAASHKHSQFAANLLQKYRVEEGPAAEAGDKGAARAGTKFLDLEQPLVPQMWRLRIGKAEYLREVHRPRHLGRPARFFASDRLEIFTMTPWWVIPLVWGPVALGAAWLGMARLRASGAVPPALLWPLWGAGLFLWTAIEYGFHRILFHIDAWMPDHPLAFLAHFLFHGVHHFLPMDKYRLVMPPLLFAFFALNFFAALSVLLPFAQLLVLGSGVMVGYILYDLMHYFFHHGSPLSSVGHVQAMKTYHMDHHYVDDNLGFGVTTKLWDRVFGTLLPPSGATA